MRVAVVAFTRDLRVRDHPALTAAAASAERVVPLFVLDPAVVEGPGRSPNRLAFLAGALHDLDESLRRLGAALVVRRGNFVDEVLRVAHETGAGDVHLSADVSGFAQRRLAALRRAAEPARVAVAAHDGVTVVPPGALAPAGGGEFKVFTPYLRRWLATPTRPVAGAPRRLALPDGLDGTPLPSALELVTPADAGSLPPGGERAGSDRLRRWERDGLASYAGLRDHLAADATSKLSPYLHLGCLSALEVATRAAGIGGEGADEFVRQLAWRDFFHQVLAARPDAARADYRSRATRWVDDEHLLEAWRSGRTGVPVVDAAMRQLAAEGFVPNRARMIVASYLTRDLGVDWRLGASHFLRHLVDGDVACNQLNWQWVAGTGTDPRRHRVLNPVRQGRRFDRRGDYVRRWVPELAAVPAAQVHDPDAATRRGCGYPERLG